MTSASFLASTASSTAYSASSIAACANMDRVVRVGLGPLGIALCHTGVVLCLLGIDALADLLRCRSQSLWTWFQ